MPLVAAIAIAEQQQDYVTRDLMIAQLKDTEEDHATGWNNNCV